MNINRAAGKKFHSILASTASVSLRWWLGLSFFCLAVSKRQPQHRSIVSILVGTSSAPMLAKGGWMVSVDHYRQELRAQISSAATQGAQDIVIKAKELSRSLRRGVSPPNACVDAMQAEMRPGDVVLDDAGKGEGVTVRYLLPRGERQTGGERGRKRRPGSVADASASSGCDGPGSAE